ncbi:acyltransferase [Streptomyces sp. SL13]|uniref:Acyltransferase n=1 Tax=Streptantibioticus silvisoli TaxID=2705255 RepID=A0AA90H315_9ACTN|nr:acyltransferase [Streptantibioticus silvisoli]MDI5963964.1 acyltransferase [Streptantibioticus silvisoli]MDI5970073.1 acyltransferase [Streptantibioticus silvisoli]
MQPPTFAEPPPAFDPTALPPSCRIGKNVRIFAHSVVVGDEVTFGDDVTIVADTVEIGARTSIGRGADLRASALRLGDGCEIHRDVRVLAADRFAVGDVGRICAGVDVLCRDFRAGRLFYFGEGGTVGMGGTTTSTATVVIGDRVTISQFAILNSNCLIEIGDNVGTGSYLAVWTHGYHFGHGPLEGTRPAYAPVQVARNAWLGFHVTLLPGVHVGENTVVAAASVVTGDLPADVLAGGVPAKVKRQLDRRPVTGEPARDALVEVLRIWAGELRWKGCRVIAADYDSPRAELLVRDPGGTRTTRVVLVCDAAPLPVPAADETLIIVSVEDRPDLAPAATGSVTAFGLRTGALHGLPDALGEDLRNQLRRHAMPCGDTRPFVSIDPPGFGRLRAAAVAR